MKNHVVNWFNYPTHSNQRGEVNDMPSETVPGMVLSLGELLKRYTVPDILAGRTSVQRFDGQFTDNDLIPDNLERMGEIERIEAARDIAASIEAERGAISSRSAERKRIRDAEAEKPKGDVPPPTSSAPPAPPLQLSARIFGYERAQRDQYPKIEQASAARQSLSCPILGLCNNLLDVLLLVDTGLRSVLRCLLTSVDLYRILEESLGHTRRLATQKGERPGPNSVAPSARQFIDMMLLFFFTYVVRSYVPRETFLLCLYL